MGGAFAAQAALVGANVAADVAGRHAQGAQHLKEHVRKVLAHAAAVGQYFIYCGLDGGDAFLILKIGEHIAVAGQSSVVYGQVGRAELGKDVVYLRLMVDAFGVRQPNQQNVVL